MKFEELDEQAANELPYSVVDASSAQRVAVAFEPLTAADLPLLDSEPWLAAVFQEAWRDFATRPAQALKLVRRAPHSPAPLGLLRLGRIPWPGGPLMDSLLETLPGHQGHPPGQAYRGVGRVLVARMVIESYRNGGNGQVLVRSRRGVAGFYLRLGFGPLPGAGRRYLLRAVAARALLAELFEAA